MDKPGTSNPPYFNKCTFLGSTFGSGNANINGGINFSPLPTSQELISYRRFDKSVVPEGPEFASRKTELESLREALKEPSNSGAKIAVLTGMGGAGKSTLARKYVLEEEKERKKTADSFKTVVWINAEEEKDIQSVLRIMIESIRDEDARFKRFEKDASYIYQLMQPPILFVFDNVEDAPMLCNYLPDSTDAKTEIIIIITTRQEKFCWFSSDIKKQFPDESFVEINQLEASSCKEYVEARLRNFRIANVEQDWEELAEYFGYLVLAMEAATAAIIQEVREPATKKPFTIKRYMATLKEKDILKPQSDEEEPVQKTYSRLRTLWDNDFKKIETLKCGATALAILNSMAYMPPIGVPHEWFETMCKKESAASSKEVGEALKLLRSWSLARITEKDHIVIHGVLRETMMSRVRSTEKTQKTFLEWLLPAVQSLHLELGRDNKSEYFFGTLETILDRTQNVSISVPTVGFHIHFQNLSRCHKYLVEVTADIASGSLNVDFEIMDQLIQSRLQVVVERLLSMYAALCLPNCSTQSLTSMCIAVTNLSSDRPPFADIQSCSKFADIMAQVLKKAIDVLGLQQLKLDMLVKPVIAVLWGLWCHSRNEPASAFNLLAILTSFEELIQDLLSSPNISYEAPETAGQLLQSTMLWNWLMESCEELKTQPRLEQLISSRFDLEPTEVSQLHKFLQPYNKSPDQINFKAHLLAAVCKLLESCKTKECSEECKLIESFIMKDGNNFEKYFPPCILPFTVLYKCFESHTEMLQTSARYQQSNDLQFYTIETMKCNKSFVRSTSKRRLAENDIPPKDEFRNLFPDTVRIFSWIKGSPEVEASSIASGPSSAVPETNYNDINEFHRFLNGLESMRSNNVHIGTTESLLSNAAERAVAQYRGASEGWQSFECMCVHTKYQMIYAQELLRIGRIDKALDVAEAVIEHLLFCSANTSTSEVMKLVMEAWFESFDGMDDNGIANKMQDRVQKLLLKLVRGHGSLSLSSKKHTTGSFQSRASVVIFLSLSGSAVEAIDPLCEMVEPWTMKLNDYTYCTWMDAELYCCCVNVMHSLMLRDDVTNMKRVCGQWKRVIEVCTSRKKPWLCYSMRVLEFIVSSKDADWKCEDGDTIFLEEGVERSFGNNVILIDLWWSEHILRWYQRHRKKSSASLFKDQDWISKCNNHFATRCRLVRSKQEISDCLLYYQTIEVLLFGGKKQIEEVLQKAVERLQEEPGWEHEHFQSVIARGALFRLVQEYLQKKLWFQQCEYREKRVLYGEQGIIGRLKTIFKK